MAILVFPVHFPKKNPLSDLTPAPRTGRFHGPGLRGFGENLGVLDERYINTVISLWTYSPL